MNDQDLRDCFAMFALTGLLMRGNNNLIEIPKGAYEIADHMLEVRNAKPEDDGGIATIKKRKVTK